MKSSVIAALISAGLSFPAFAQEITTQMSVFELVETIDDQGQLVIERVDPVSILPSDVVLYEVALANTGQEVARDVVMTFPVDPAMIVGVDSVTGEGIDVTFATRENPEEFDLFSALTVTDALGRPIAARAEDIGAMRITLASLEADQTAAIQYVATVR